MDATCLTYHLTNFLFSSKPVKTKLSFILSQHPIITVIKNTNLDGAAVPDTGQVLGLAGERPLGALQQPVKETRLTS